MLFARPNFAYPEARCVSSSNLKDIEPHITIPAHDPLRIGTLGQVLNEVATYLELSRDRFVQALFR